jgi:beta-lactamase family protein
VGTGDRPGTHRTWHSRDTQFPAYRVLTECSGILPGDMRVGRRILPGTMGIAILPIVALASSVGSSAQESGQVSSDAARIGSTGAARALTTSTGVRRAQRFARRREGVVAFAVLGEQGRPRGLPRTVSFPSASVAKAMLLVAVLRRADGRRLSDTERLLLPPMITVSDNDAASAMYASVGGRGLNEVARVAGMRKFADVGHWAGSRITAADQARFFLRIDRLVPATHRRYARRLLSSIVSSQRWGIARIARRRHMKIFFKGGWRSGITHQVALLERGGRRFALAVLTSGGPSQAYGEETIERIALRVLRPRSSRNPKATRHVARECSNGRVTRKVVPRPCSLSTSTSPW